MKKYKPVSLRKVKTHPLSLRKSKVEIEMAAVPHVKMASFRKFMDDLPFVLAAADLKSDFFRASRI